MESFQNIHLDISKQAGRLRIADYGMGWKPVSGEGGLSLDPSNFGPCQWSRCARGYEMRVMSRTQGIIQLDGFQQDDFERLQKCLKVLLGINLENKEHALRGWNWGKADFSRSELTFNVQNRPAFEIPYSEIANTNLAGKNEVALQLSAVGTGEAVGTDGKMGGAKAKGRKGGGAADQLVEMRFYIPGTATTKKEKEDGEDGEVSDGDAGEEVEENAANVFYNTLADKAEIGAVAGDTFATFLDILHLTPRGRFDLDMYENSFRMRGKTYDYKISYESVKKVMMLPKPDEQHMLLVFGLDPPLRQGQTTYPFLVMQLRKEEEVTLEMNMTDEMINERYSGKLQKSYEAPLYSIVAKVFNGLANKRISAPARDFESHHAQKGVKCSVKASEGILFCMERAFMFVPKPAQFITYDQISLIVFSRVGGAISASRTFDMTIEMRGGGEFAFSNINREEQHPLENFFASKNLKVRNEMVDDSNTLLKKALNNEPLSDSDEQDVVAGADRGSADEDSESPDEDFKASSESDVAEEYDSAHSSSGSDAEMEDAQSDPEERPRKKAKSAK